MLAVGGSIALAGKAIIAKVAYRYDVDAVTVLMWRMLVALGPFVWITWWAGRGKPRLSARDMAALVGLGFLGHYLASYLDFLGLVYISAGLERLIIYLTPTLVLAFGIVLFGQRATRKQLAAIAVGYAGMLTVFGHEVSFAGPHVALGALLVFGSAAAYSLYLSYSGQLVVRLGALRVVGWASTIACLFCIAQFVVLRPLSAAAVPADVLCLMLINGTVCTIAPLVMVMMAVERVGAATAAQAGMFGPLSTIALGIAILDEPFSLWIAAGTLLVVGSVYILARKPRPAR